MKKVILFASVLFLSACGYDGSYRYACQDPANWDSDDCKPPICKVDGACTETLLGFNPSETTIADTVPTQETVAP